MFDIDDILINLWESKYKSIGNKLIIGATSVAPGYLSYRYIKKKTLRQYLNWKYDDIYNPLYLTKHCWISGVQGTGKSNKLRRIFVNTFVKQGWGGIYIDTHGTADLILRSIPKNRWKDVIYIAPWLKRVYGINILQRYSNDSGEVDRIAEDVVEVFKKMYSRSWGDKLELVIRFSVKAILIAEENCDEINNPTIFDVYKILSDAIYRNKVLKFVDNEIITDFLIGLKNDTALNKLINPLSSDDVLLFTCQKEGINLYEAMEQRKIIICNLDNDKLSTNANLIASLLVSTINQCAAKRSESSPHPYFVIAMDEGHEYANKHLATLISQMRKKNVIVLLANQYKDQFPSAIQPAISMCQTKFTHTIADEDLAWVSKIYSKWYTKEQLVTIPFYSCLSDVHIPGKQRSPKINMVAPFIPDNGWEWAKKIKYISLGNAQDRYKLLEEARKVQDITIISEEKISFEGEIILE